MKKIYWVRGQIGLHIYHPITRKQNAEEIREFVKKKLLEKNDLLEK